jgi:hypothetical protein
MSFTNTTPNYKLPQYVGTDKPTFLGDFNNAMDIIDTQMHTNKENAGEGIASLQEAQTQLTETQSTLTEVQKEVANVSGIASGVNENVQQALSAANDASEAATQAQSKIESAVTAANRASADAQAAQQVANGNVTTLNNLSDRVATLEEKPQEIVTKTFNISGNSNTKPITIDVSHEGYTPVSAGVTSLGFDLSDSVADRGGNFTTSLSGNTFSITFNLQSDFISDIAGKIVVVYKPN